MSVHNILQNQWNWASIQEVSQVIQVTKFEAFLEAGHFSTRNRVRHVTVIDM